MTIKIKAPRAYMSEWTVNGKLVPCEISWYSDNVQSGTNKRAVRVVYESDWRNLMKLVKAVEKFNEHHMIYEALVALEKKK
jgi:hypothetical protein